MKILLGRPIILLLLLTLPAAYLLYRRLAAATSLRSLLALAGRSLTLVLLVLALSRMATAVDTDRVNLLFVLDRSDSLDDLTQGAALETFRSSLEGMGQSDTTGLVVFGRGASVELTPRDSVGEVSLTSAVESSTTDISGALHTAMAALPEEGVNRIVLMTDGNQTRGDALETARSLAAAGIAVFPVPVSSGLGENELFIKDVIAPGEVRAGQALDFTVLVETLLEPASASITVWSDDTYVGEDVLDLRSGENSVGYSAAFDTPGLHRLEVLLSSPEDTIDANNRYEVFIRVTGRPSLLYVSERGRRSEAFVEALRTQDIEVSTLTTQEIPNTLSGLIEYDAVVLDDVPGFELSLSKMEILESYVRNAGGGLLMIGGDNSFGLGGYYGTPVEKALPVDMDVASSAGIPSLTLLMIVDKSGSMGGYTAGGETKLDLVKSAALSAVELLNPFYRAGVLAFDADAEWAVPITTAGDRARIVDGLAGLTPGGGTNLFGAMQAAYEAVRPSESSVRHLLILSDGLTEEGDFQELTGRMAAEGITVSTVAVGADADRELMADLAGRGGGRHYYTDDIQDVPRIFASEAIIASRGLLVEEAFLPRPGVPHEIVQGIDTSALPLLEGFVLTYPKASAEQVLLTSDGKPLLAVRRYGLGRTAAFTSDLRGRWGRSWVEWPELPRLLAQLVRWVERPSAGEELSVTVEEKRGDAVIAVDAEAGTGDFLNFLDLTASVVYPDGRAEEVAVGQIGPGQYRGSFAAEESGPYVVTVRENDSRQPPQVHGLVVPYSREYRDFEPNLPLLEGIAETTGGRVIAREDAAGLRALYSSGSAGWRAERELGHWFILAAALVLLAEIAVRKLRLSAGFFAGLLLRLRSGRPRPKPDYAEARRSMAEKERKEREERARRDLGFWYAHRSR